MTAPTPAARSVAGLFSPDGRLITVPRKAARREQLLAHLAETLFEPGRGYTEAEVNDALRTVHDDAPALRRDLVEAGHLARTRDGSDYRRAGTAE
ncbi:DUF2087 domain-containing protein [Streptomyces sp. CBMA123]|uniref:DUF2087 domain-containing protein n=1 Tax=Streptomyces sp. CBMA123 TaxID=1896313 RepID=UPI001661BED4|nr:DUF2087 domain-containing protein [Streptomyces sp. CBMA123]MBD0690994.1 hypothetical protein [Streptomyces sp. CBMA123]